MGQGSFTFSLYTLEKYFGGGLRGVHLFSGYYILRVFNIDDNATNEIIILLEQ